MLQLFHKLRVHGRRCLSDPAHVLYLGRVLRQRLYRRTVSAAASLSPSGVIFWSRILKTYAALKKADAAHAAWTVVFWTLFAGQKVGMGTWFRKRKPKSAGD